MTSLEFPLFTTLINSLSILGVFLYECSQSWINLTIHFHRMTSHYLQLGWYVCMWVFVFVCVFMCGRKVEYMKKTCECETQKAYDCEMVFKWCVNDVWWKVECTKKVCECEIVSKWCIMQSSGVHRKGVLTWMCEHEMVLKFFFSWWHDAHFCELCVMMCNSTSWIIMLYSLLSGVISILSDKVLGTFHW